MRKTQGIALVVTLAILVLVALLVFATSMTTMVSQWTARNERGATEAYYVAEAGLQQWKTRLFQAYRWQLDRTMYDVGPTLTRSECDSVLARGVDWNRSHMLGDDEPLPVTRTGTVPMGSGVGTYTVTVALDPSRPRFLQIRSVGRYNGSQATVQATFDLSNAGPFDYALFIGRGAANRHLNGGAIIRGGLYVQGESSNPDKVLIDSTGSFAMLNEYDYSSDPVLSSRLNSDMRRSSDLCATLRVQYGRVKVGGSSKYGTPSNRLLGAYVGDAADDIYGTPDVCTNNRGICADDRGAFDLPPVSAPRFQDFNGRCSYLVGIPWTDCMREWAKWNGGVRITSGEVSIYPYWSWLVNPSSCDPQRIISRDISKNALVLGNKDVDCTYRVYGHARTYGFRYTSGGPGQPGTLEILEILYLSGIDLRLEKAVNYKARNYFEDPSSNLRNATIFVEGGSIYIKGDLLPDTTWNTFPNQVLGLVAQNNIEQLAKNAVGVFYAGNRFRTQGGQRTLGTVMANKFCTTSPGGSECDTRQQAEITHIPTINNLPISLQFQDQTKYRQPLFRVMSFERR